MPLPVEICPDPERIAAFIDGGMTASERQDFVVHLTDCEACYEVFSEALALKNELEEEDSEDVADGKELGMERPLAEVAEIPSRSGNPRSFGLLIAASVVGAILLGYLFLSLRTGSVPDSGELVAEFQGLKGREAFEGPGWSSPHNLTRGSGGVQYSSEAVFLGARLLDLQLALALEDRREAVSLLSQLGGWRGTIPLRAEAFEQMARDLSEAGSLAEIAQGVALQESHLMKATRDDDSEALGLILGRWAEAGRQACRARELSLLESETFGELTRLLMASKLEKSTLERVRKVSTRLELAPQKDALGKLQMVFEELLE
ncbi:MAG: zf-HC2 domain-containing protein [Deltaproteobacteria bacterium]|nr:zf-HC2 domain-containing protein [Deltaproteobacteria bacterium]